MLLREHNLSPRGTTSQARSPRSSASQNVVAANGLSPRRRSSSLHSLPVSNGMSSNGMSRSSSRLLRPEEELQLQALGEHERQLDAAREAKEEQRKARMKLEELARQQRRAMERRAKEERDRRAEEDRLSRIRDIEERRQAAERQKLNWDNQKVAAARVMGTLATPSSPSWRSHGRSRNEEHELVEKKMLVQSDKELGILRDKEARRREAALRTLSEERRIAEDQAQLQQVRDDQAEHRRKESQNRQREREQCLDRQARRRQESEDRRREKQARDIAEREARNYREWLRQKAEEEASNEKARLQGERENLQRMARDVRMREEALQKKQQMLTRHAQDLEVKTKTEAMARRDEEARRRRVWDIEQRRLAEEANRLEREARRKAEDEGHLGKFEPPPRPQRVHLHRRPAVGTFWTTSVRSSVASSGD